MTIYQTFGSGLACIGVVLTVLAFIYAALSESYDSFTAPAKISSYLNLFEAWVEEGFQDSEPLKPPQYVLRRMNTQQNEKYQPLLERYFAWKFPSEAEN